MVERDLKMWFSRCEQIMATSRHYDDAPDTVTELNTSGVLYKSFVKV